VAPRTYRRWRSEGNPPPAALRLLAVLAGFVPWDGWDRWEVHRGLLFPPGYRRGGISPGDIYALVFLHQLVSAYREENVRLRAEVRDLAAKLRHPDTSPEPLPAELHQDGLPDVGVSAVL
jgi:hypothetical protein